MYLSVDVALQQRSGVASGRGAKTRSVARGTFRTAHTYTVLWKANKNKVIQTSCWVIQIVFISNPNQVLGHTWEIVSRRFSLAAAALLSARRCSRNALELSCPE